MTRPRSQLVSLEATPYYHCISRCVRRSFLCGEDRYSGKNFDHRKPWLVERLALLADIFAINIAAYAIMSNHYHLVLHIDQARAEAWSTEEVIRRWTRLFKGPMVVQRYCAGISLQEFEKRLLRREVENLRHKLASLSKFMSCLNHFLACRANQEDGCTGRFWEGRFKSQALLDETALLSCMTYVDLNPVRAGLTDSLEGSDFTSVQARLKLVGLIGQQQSATQSASAGPKLLPFHESLTENDAGAAIPFNLNDYLQLADWTGRAVRTDKPGYIKGPRPQLLNQLKLSRAQWHVLALEIQQQSILMLHGLEILDQLARRAAKQKAA